MLPKVSIVIPVYDVKGVFLDAINSVLMQSFTNYEILVIDDGSTQPISDLRKMDSRIHVIRHDKNKGAPAARNTGILHACGELVAFLDSDDTWLPDKLKVQSSWMHQNQHVGATTTGFFCYSEEGDSLEIPHNQKNWYRYFMRGMSLSPGTNLMVWRKYMIACLYNEAFLRLEDLDWALRFSKEYDFWIIQQPLAIINRGKRPSALKMELADLKLLEIHSTDFHKQGFFYGRYCIGKRYLEIATHYFREKNRRKGNFYLWKAIKENPFQHPSMYVRIIDYVLGTSFIKNIKEIRKKILYKGKLHNENNSHNH